MTKRERLKIHYERLFYREGRCKACRAPVLEGGAVYHKLDCSVRYYDHEYGLLKPVGYQPGHTT